MLIFWVQSLLLKLQEHLSDRVAVQELMSGSEIVLTENHLSDKLCCVWSVWREKVITAIGG